MVITVTLDGPNWCTLLCCEALVQLHLLGSLQGAAHSWALHRAPGRRDIYGFFQGLTRATGWSNHHFLGGHQVFVPLSPDDFDFYDVDLTIVDSRWYYSGRRIRWFYNPVIKCGKGNFIISSFFYHYLSLKPPWLPEGTEQASWIETILWLCHLPGFSSTTPQILLIKSC